MTTDLFAKLEVAVRLGDILVHTQQSIAALLDPPALLQLEVEGAKGPPADVVIGPYPHDEGAWSSASGHRRIKPFSSWDELDLRIRIDENVGVHLSLCYRASAEELGLTSAGKTDAQRFADAASRGYHAWLAIWRNQESFCLGVFLAGSIAALNRSMVSGDIDRLQLGELVMPEALMAKLSEYRGAASFEQLARQFCDAVDQRYGG